MDARAWIWTCLILPVCLPVIHGTPIGTSTISCNAVGNTIQWGPVDEGYQGDVEVVNGIEAGRSVQLVPYLFPDHIEFLEMSFTPGDTSATVRTKMPLDADVLASTDSTLYYSIMCDGTSQFQHMRTLKLNDINDNGPLFTEKLYSANVSEITEVDSPVLQIKAVDADSTPENNQVTYTFVPATEDFLLTNTGVFILKKRLDYNIVNKYNFEVTARDNSGLNDTTSVVIWIEDFDNLNPAFSHSLYRAFVPENQVGFFHSIQPEVIKAQDGDTGINVSVIYSISVVFPERYERNFNINQNSGVLSLITAIDREEMNGSAISINIKAAQTDNNLKTADAVVSVTVEDVNDNAPEFDQTDYVVTLLENSLVDAFLLKATVTDLDQGGFVGTLKILPDSAPFSISPDGTVRVKNSTTLDREATERIVFQIEASERDHPNRNVSAQVSVTLLDENDNSPVFTSDTYDGKVFANQTVGMLLIQVKAEDPDADLNGAIKYSIDFGNGDEYFSIDEDTGDITLAKTIPLVEDTSLEFPLYITARDGGIVSRSSSAQVTIRAPGNSKPQFLQKVYQGTVEEEQDPGVFITKVNFLALGEIAPNLQVQTESDKFSISPTGEFTTRVKLDYDEAPHNYSVEISISDGTTSDSAVVEVHVTDINDNAPVFANTTVHASIPENTAVGANVTTVSATDKDSNFNKEIRYSLKGGAGAFAIDRVSGIVSVAGPLDRETTANYSLEVLAEDLGRPARSATSTLLVQISDINDNVPKFLQADYQVEVLETEKVLTSLLTLEAVDPDEGANGRVTYSIARQTPPSERPVFELDASNGTLRLAESLNNSEVQVYTLTVQASDGGVPALVGNSSVSVKVKDVNNNPPEFSRDRYDVAVSENLAAGASILTLEVTDRDEGGFTKGHFLYANDTFDINMQGVVSLRRDVSLDRETKDSYILQVVAVDQPTDGLRGTAQLNITVLDYNDNTPQFPSIPDPLQISEGDYSMEKPGEIFAIVPTDADIGLNGEVNVSLASPHPLFTFGQNGMLMAIGRLDRESRETYDLVVKASDNGIPKRENITTIQVSLDDINDNPPEFSSSSYVSSILIKDAEEGKLILTLSATDQDIGDNSRITYSFIAGNSPLLALNNETGAVTLTSNLTDVMEDTSLALTAMARDHGRPPLNSTARVVINLRVASLVEVVAFQSSSYNFSVSENLPAGVTVGRVLASSGSDLYDVAYELRTHTDLFSVDSDGVILTTEELDREQQEWLILDVEARDTRTPPTSAIATVRVHVENVNESPLFPDELYEASVYSIAPYKTPVIQVKALDPDFGDVNQLIYSLSDSSPSFDVEPDSGLVYVVSALDVAGETTELKVKATDPHGLFAEATVEVTVQGSASSDDVVTISLNQPANTVEKKVSELEGSLSKVLAWTVNVLQVSSANGGTSYSRESARSLVSFVALDGSEVVSSEEVTEKLQSQSAAVMAELALVFGEELHFDIEQRPQSSSSNQVAVIVLGVFLALTVFGLIAAVILIIKFKKEKEKPQASDKESFDISRDIGFTNTMFLGGNSKISEQAKTSPEESRAEGRMQKMDIEKAQWDKRTDEEHTAKTDKPKQDKESAAEDNQTSSL
ncbi:unnamed protein product [Menidia menidia]|uniref:(Atlantic silverside) hypothetical protein n=1 Tax=Menidia menidia TaxID=238744 RepID=A0A8S4B7I0_9TELE|nr:unnamed protein product [Menidia menidia]